MAALDLAEFDRLAGAGFSVIPLTRTLQLDRETPVSLYQRFAGGRAFFLLESAALGEETGRYSFIGLDRRWRVTTRDGDTVCRGGRRADARRLAARRPARGPRALPDPRNARPAGLHRRRRRVRLLRLRAAPRATRTRPEDDAWPDVDFSFPGAVLICDHLRHSTTVVVNAVIEAETPALVYDAATERLDDDRRHAAVPRRPPATRDHERVVATGARGARRPSTSAASPRRLSNFTRERYGAVVERAKEHIVAGDVFQVVPSQQFRRPTSVDPLTLYRVLRALNPSPYMYLLDNGDNQIVGASPEMLVRVHDGVVSTRPIAGHAPARRHRRGGPRLEHEILRDEKEIAEHVMLVDLGRNDVGRVAAPGSVASSASRTSSASATSCTCVSQVSGACAPASTPSTPSTRSSRRAP